jgi:hypothetical protein
MRIRKTPDMAPIIRAIRAGVESGDLACARWLERQGLAQTVQTDRAAALDQAVTIQRNWEASLP